MTSRSPPPTESTLSVTLTADLPPCVVQTQTDQVIVDALARPVPNEKSVELHYFDLNRSSVDQLESLFSGCEQEYQSLSLEKCTLADDQFFAMMSERLTRNRVRLVSISMKSCKSVTMASLVAMSTLFTSSLVTLELSSCKLSRQAGIILSQSFQACTSLRHLLLADNNIRDGGLRAIADALRHFNASSGNTVVQDVDTPLPMLEQLDISRNGITSAGFTSLMQLPIQCVRTSNAIESGVGAMLLSNTSTLETLILCGNPLSKDGKVELVRSLFQGRVKSALRELDLCDCGFSSADSLDLLRRSFLEAANARQQCSLQTLYLDKGMLSTNGESSGKCPKESLMKAVKVNFPDLQLLFQSKQTKVLDPSIPEVLCASRKQSKTKAESSESTTEWSNKLQAKPNVNATLASVSIPPHSKQQQVSNVQHIRPNESLIIHPTVSDPLTKPIAIIQALPIQPSSTTTSSTTRADTVTPLPMQHIDVEYIVSKTIECMSSAFELRLGQFVSRMETQQQERNSSQVQYLTAKLEACERALPRLEARLDMLSDRITAGSAQVTTLQTDVAYQLQQLRQETMAQHLSTTQNLESLDSTQSTLLSARMKNQVEELVLSRVQASEELLYSEMDRVRAAQFKAAPTDPHVVVSAVSAHLAHFKREFDTNQAQVLRQVTNDVSSNSSRLEERIAHVEAQIGNLESVIQSEQQASLLALEAISDAFNDAVSRR